MSAQLLETPTQTFRIGAVSRLTGISTDLIRVWERRYAVVNPIRTESGNRLYTHDDITRLALIKQLLEAGDAIGAVAPLNVSELERRVDAVGTSKPAPRAKQDKTKIAVIGHALTARVAVQRYDLGDVEVVGMYHNTIDLLDHAGTLQVDSLVIEIPYLSSVTATEIEQLLKNVGANSAVVVYGFGSRRNLRRLRMLPVVTLRAPADVLDLKRACLVLSAKELSPLQQHTTNNSASSDAIQPRLYSDETLARIATLSTTVECECPHHLADLVYSLVSFEQYSANCANRTEQDAAMHRYLHATTTHARSLLETALARLVEMEGLEV